MNKRALLSLKTSICFVLCVMILGHVTVYADEVKTEWAKRASMSAGRDYFQTEVINGKIYAIGGRSGLNNISSVEVYDPSSDTWTTLAPMSTIRTLFRTEVVNGKIYAIGGTITPSFNSGFSSIEVYDPTTDTWSTLTPMSIGRYGLQTEVINGKIYAIGGSGAKPIEVYDPSTDTWTTLASMSADRYLFQTEVINGKIYAIGGSRQGSGCLSSMEAYTVTNDTSNLKATAGNSKVDLIWNAVDKATGYTIKRSTTAGGPYTTIATGVKETTYTDTNVTNGTTYYYVVTAIVNGSESWSSNEASATPQASTDPNQPTGNKALLVITMVTGERKEYEMTEDKINDFLAWYNSKAASSPTYAIEKDYNKASFTARKDYIAYEQISNFEVNEYNN